MGGADAISRKLITKMDKKRIENFVRSGYSHCRPVALESGRVKEKKTCFDKISGKIKIIQRSIGKILGGFSKMHFACSVAYWESVNRYGKAAVSTPVGSCRNISVFILWY